MSKSKARGNQRTTFAEITAGAKSAIPQAKPPLHSPVVFSFKHVCFDNPKFHYARSTDTKAYFGQFFDRTKERCRLTTNEFVNPAALGANPKSLRSHGITWGETTEKDGFKIPGDIWKNTPWQFELTANEYGRVHGFLVGNVFYVVWFDPDHLLWPKK